MHRLTAIGPQGCRLATRRAPRAVALPADVALIFAGGGHPLLGAAVASSIPKEEESTL